MKQANHSSEATSAQEVVMVDPETIRQIRDFSSLGWGTKRIASEMGLARNTVRRYLTLAPESAVIQVRPGGRCLDASHLSEAERLLLNDAEGNAVVVHRLLSAVTTPGCLRTVQRAVAPARSALRRAQVATVRFETDPGHQMQIDFGQKRVNIGGRKVKVFVFVAVLGYSRRIYVRAGLSERQDDWHEGIAGAFAHFGGVPRTLLIDNPKAMVLRHDTESREVVLHPSFKAFCKDWDVSAQACAPYRARTKGKTESGVKYVKRNALAGLSFTTFEALENHLAAWMQLADARLHGTTGEAPTERFEADERQALRALPVRPSPVRQRRLRRKVANDALVDIDTIRYSVPHRFVGTHVDVVVGDTEVCIYAGLTCVAQHRRGAEPRSVIKNHAHYDGLVRRPKVVDDSDACAPVEAASHTGSDALAAMGRSLNDYAAVVNMGQR
jgi:transposase